MWTFVGSISSILKLLLAFVLFGARVSMRLRSDIYYIGTLDTLHFFLSLHPLKRGQKITQLPYSCTHFNLAPLFLTHF